jgi:hypothetical protein
MAKNREPRKEQTPRDLSWFIGHMPFGHQGAGRTSEATFAVCTYDILTAYERIKVYGGVQHNKTPTLAPATGEEIIRYGLDKLILVDGPAILLK